MSTDLGVFYAKTLRNCIHWYVHFLCKFQTVVCTYGLVAFYGISTIVGLMPNPLYTYMLNIYDLVSFGFMAFQPL